MTPTEFLQAFHPGGPWVLTAITPDRKQIETKTFGPDTENAAREWIAKRDGAANLYFNVNLIGRPVTKKVTREDIVSVPWLHVDVDARVGKELDEELVRIETLLTKECPVLPPTVVTFSGGGYQAFWRLKEPIPINGDLARAEDAARYNKQLEIVLGGDSCHDISRIMRLPGTMNLPDAKKVARGRIPARACVHFYDPSHVYDISQFAQSHPIQVPNGGPTFVETPTANIPRLASIDELDKWKVPDRVKVIILQGHHVDEPKLGDNSRSAWLFDACCQLMRAGVPNNVIFSVITDPKFGISASVLDKGPKEVEYASRQIIKAKKCVAGDPLLLDKNTPLVSARLFIDRCRSTLMHYNDDWLAFDGVAYSALEDETVRSEIYKFLENACGPYPDTPFDPTKAKVTNVVDALEAAAHKPRDVFVPPCWLVGTGPSALEIVTCQNGLLHLPSGELHPLTSRFFTRNALSFAYKADAHIPERWFRFLEELWPDERDVVEMLQEIFGYVLIPDTSQQKIFMLVGPARSGKGTIARVLTHLVGKHNTCAPTLKSMSGDFGLEPLIGKQLAIISDLRLGPKTDQASVAENLLRISGEDMVSANRKYKRSWDGRLSVRFLIMTNELPRFADASGALANRFVPLVMRKSFLGHEDLGLLGEMLPELPGILNWSIEGWRRLRERCHFKLPSSSEDAIQHLEDLASPEAAFIRDECEFNTEAIISKQELYEAWRLWCVSRDVFPASMEIFSTRLQAAAHGRVETCKPRKGDRRVPSYKGIRLHDSDEQKLPF